MRKRTQTNVMKFRFHFHDVVVFVFGVSGFLATGIDGFDAIVVGFVGDGLGRFGFLWCSTNQPSDIADSV